MICRWWTDAASEGDWNMALDQALIECCAPESAIFRFYAWQRPTLSLGYFQRYDQRVQHAASAHCRIVRRPSGGGAILHDREITYSLVVPAGHAWARYGRTLDCLVHGALIDALATFAIEAQLAGAASSSIPGREPFLCFKRRAAVDVLLRGHKIAGTALRRTRGATLLHGSVLLERSACAPELPGINDLSTNQFDADLLRHAWLIAVKHRLPGEWIPSAANGDELRQAEMLATQRYCQDSWTRLR